MEKTNVGIVGLGTVGQGVAKLLLDHGDRTARHAGRTLWLKHAIVRDLSKPRDIAIPDGVLSDDIERLICLLYTSPSPRDGLLSRMPSSA